VDEQYLKQVFDEAAKILPEFVKQIKIYLLGTEL